MTQFIFNKKKEQSLIEYALFHGSIQIFQYLLNSVELIQSYWLQANHGNNPEIKILLSKSEIDVNKEGIFKTEMTKEIETPLCRAVSLNDTDIIQLLLSHSQVDINQYTC